MRRSFVSFAWLGAVIIMAANLGVAAAQEGKKARVYIGTYTDGDSKGIYRSELDLATGELSPAELVAELENPSFLALSPTRDFLYSVCETEEFNGESGGGVAAFKIGADGSLAKLNEQPTAGGAPCHVITDLEGKTLFAANYSGGSLTVTPINPDGSLAVPLPVIQHKGNSVNADRQQSPHAHSANIDESNRILVVADLGLDKLMLYRYSTKFGAVAPHEPQPFVELAPGAGPRHFAFHPSGKHAYVINELDSTITALAYDGITGTFKKLDTVSTLPEGDFPGNSTADIHVHPSGRWLYGSNRGHDSIAMFAIERGTGKLTSLGHEKTGGKTPRNFAIDPTGQFLLAENQSSDLIRVFRINQETGKLEATGHDLKVPAPVCVQMYVVE
jgi:6-phosphogluconolactonase